MINSKIFASSIISIVLAGILSTTTNADFMDGILTEEEKQALLDQHNNLRSETALGLTDGQPMATNMIALEWDEDLAVQAKEWADGCVWEHSSGFWGENLAATAAQNTNQLSFATLTGGITGWYNEHTSYTYDSNSCSGVCGHYTQVVWATSTKLGCAYQICGPGFIWDDTFPYQTFLVCQYTPPGNYVGVLPYVAATVVDDVASDCPIEYQGNPETGLCEIAGIPTQTPTSSASPTSSPNPTGTCFDLDIEILPDYWASGETSWTLYDTDDTTVLASGGLSDFTNNVLYQYTVVCLPDLCGSGESYSWEITDTWGDGLSAGGYFKLFVGSTELFGSSDGINFGSSDTVVVDGCSDVPIIESPSSSPIISASSPPTSTPVETICLDSTLTISGTTIGCTEILAFAACGYPGASSHCPLSCEACDEYACSDSEFSFGSNVNCGMLANLDPSDLDYYCSLEPLYSTCRGLCNTCNL